MICAANDGLFAQLCATVERADLVDQSAVRHQRAAPRSSRGAQEGARDRRSPPGPAAEWLDILGAAGVPCGPVSTVAEALTSEQATARELVIDVGGLPHAGQSDEAVGYPEIQPEPAPDAR